MSAWLLGHDQHEHEHGHGHDDHNLRAAYLHVLADALTSVLGRWFGWAALDPLMGVVGGAVILHWSWACAAAPPGRCSTRRRPATRSPASGARSRPRTT